MANDVNGQPVPILAFNDHCNISVKEGDVLWTQEKAVS